jgi:hypothetical protein
MLIWKLTPLDSRVPAWRKSWYTDEAIIRAESAEHARRIADGVFVMRAQARLGEDTSWQVLWRKHVLVHCERVRQSGYAEHGDAAVLVPALASVKTARS